MPFLKLSEKKTYRHSLELIVGRCTIKTFREGDRGGRWGQGVTVEDKTS